MFFDLPIILFIQQFNQSIIRGFFILITTIGDFAFIWLALGVVFFLFVYFEKRAMFMLALSNLISYLFVDLVFKNLFKRTRPYLAHEEVQLFISKITSYSFPSGHAASSFISAVILSQYFPKYKYYFYTLATLISFSRVYVGVHYPSDVILGGLFGFGLGKLVIYIFNQKSPKMVQPITSNKRSLEKGCCQ